MKKTPKANKRPVSLSPSVKLAKVVRMVRNHYEALRADRYRLEHGIRQDRTLTQQEFRAVDRLKAYALGNEAYENDSIGAIVDTCVRLSIGTKGGKPFFLGDDAAWNQTVWDEWARNCGYTEGENWNELLSTILRTVKIHGDCLILIDGDLTDSKVRLWDADQIVSLNDADFARWGVSMGVPTQGDDNSAIWRQVEGCVLDPDGRVQGYFVTMKRNRYAVSLEEATYLPASICKRISYHTRISQYRGEPSILPLMDLTNDTRQLIKAEVAAARNHSETSILLAEPAAADEVASVLSAVSDDTDGLADEVKQAAGLAGDDLESQVASLLNAQPEDLTAIQGKSAIGHIKPGTEVHNLDNGNRPSQPIQQWIDKLADLNGQRLGVLSCLARGRADNSYSSGQIELSISWSKFEEDQKMLERLVVDYAVHAICGNCHYVVQWPKAFEIDPQKSEATLDAQLKGGRTSFQSIMGPDWRKNIDSMKEFLDYCKETGVDPNVFSWYGETSAGNAREMSPAVSTPDESSSDYGD